jgi:hypothetical protein
MTFYADDFFGRGGTAAVVADTIWWVDLDLSTFFPGSTTDPDTNVVADFAQPSAGVVTVSVDQKTGTRDGISECVRRKQDIGPLVTALTAAGWTGTRAEIDAGDWELLATVEAQATPLLGGFLGFGFSNSGTDDGVSVAQYYNGTDWQTHVAVRTSGTISATPGSFPLGSYVLATWTLFEAESKLKMVGTCQGIDATLGIITGSAYTAAVASTYTTSMVLCAGYESNTLGTSAHQCKIRVGIRAALVGG